jgi:hypothetical protein
LKLILRRFGLSVVGLAEVLPSSVELRFLPKMLGLSVPMPTKEVSYLTQYLLVLRKLALLEVELALFLLS